MKKKIIIIAIVILALVCLFGTLFAFGVFDEKDSSNDKSKDKVTWSVYTQKNTATPQPTQGVDGNLDANGNDIPDCFENSDYTTDTDKDGISDYNEIIYTLTNPLLADSDNNNTTDSDEDNDKDGISNCKEVELRTSPTSSDTDADGLDDSEEINTYSTDPLKKDTDDDGASDSWEVANGTKPTEFNERFSITTNCTSQKITASVELSASGAAAESISITPVLSNSLINDTIPGYIGPAFEYLTNGDIGLASISFEFDNSLLSKPNFQPTIYCLNEDTQRWYELDTTVTGNKATIKTTHFSKYILLDKSEYATYTKSEYEIDDSLDNGTDSNNDGITDYITKLMCDGTIRTGTGTTIFGNQSYEEVQANDDLDGDGIKNGEEVVINYVAGIPEDAFQFNNHYYMVYDEGYNWLDVQAFCESMGGYMLTITSHEEQEFVKTLISNGDKKCYWLGATDITKEGQWVWITGEPWEYQNWKSGEPNNGDAGEDYAELMTWNDYTWNDGEKEGDSDEFSKENHGYICEWDNNNVSSRTAIYLNSSPICDDTDKDGFKDALDPTPNDADVFASMDLYKDYFFKGETTVTFFTKQPLWNSRMCIYNDAIVSLISDLNTGFFNGEYEDILPSLLNGKYRDFGGHGHSYLGIDYSNGNKEYFGYYSDTDMNEALLALSLETVNGKILDEIELLSNEDDTENKSVPEFTVAKTFVINDEQVDKLLKFKETYPTDNYNLTSNNCTTFAVNALKECELDVRISERQWTFYPEELKYDDILAQEILAILTNPLKLPSEAVILRYFGYNPADAAEDIKRYNEYLVCVNYELNDGSIVTGYQAVYYNLYNDKTS
ncbi:MAG: hypothetical protein IJD02_03375 [Lachnospiraceae bacterium]|nr:hypothetical protein [Lachnospiraceae bacterium]